MASTVRLRVNRFEQIAQTAGLPTNAAQAAHCKITEGGLSKLKNGKQGPAARSIGAILAAFPQWSFEDLFEVVSTDKPEAA